MSHAPQKNPLSSAIAQIVGDLGRTPDQGGVSLGARAELRRFDPDEPLPFAAWRLLSDTAPRAWLDGLSGKTRSDAERALALVAAIAAEAGPPGEQTIGAALAALRYAEARFVRLLRARGLHEVANEARMAARRCATGGETFAIAGPFGAFGPFIVTAALRRRDADEKAHAIARDYFITQSKLERAQREDA